MLTKYGYGKSLLTDVRGNYSFAYLTINTLENILNKIVT